MLKARTELELEIEYIKQDIYKAGNIERFVKDSYEELKGFFTLGKLTGIFNGRFPLVQLSEEELFHLTQTLSKDYEICDVSKWFLDSEIKEWINNKGKLIEDLDTITLNKVSFNGNKLKPEYLCYITYKDLAALANSGKLEYDMTLQRSPQIITKLGRTIEIPTVNWQSVESISEKMLAGEFLANQITLNILNDGNEFHYFHQDKLVIDVTKGKVLIIDGFHRVTALCRSIQKNPHLDGVLILNIKNLDAEEVRVFIYQESLANRHNSKTVEKFNINNKITLFTNKINSYMNADNNFFYHKIKTPISPSGFISEDLFREGLALSKMDTIINDEQSNILSLNYYVCNFYQSVANYLTISLKDRAHILLEDQVFIIGLMIPLYTFYIEQIREDKIYDYLNALHLDSNMTDFKFQLPLTKNTRQTLKKRFLAGFEGVK